MNCPLGLDCDAFAVCTRTDPTVQDFAMYWKAVWEVLPGHMQRLFPERTDQEDCLHETWIAMSGVHVTRMAEPGICYYLRTVLKSKLYDVLRKRKRLTDFLMKHSHRVGTPTDAGTPSKKQSDVDVLDPLNRALSRLPQDLQRLAELLAAGYKPRQIQQMLNIRQKAYDYRLRAIREAVQRECKREGIHLRWKKKGGRRGGRDKTEGA